MQLGCNSFRGRFWPVQCALFANIRDFLGKVPKRYRNGAGGGDGDTFAVFPQKMGVSGDRFGVLRRCAVVSAVVSTVSTMSGPCRLFRPAGRGYFPRLLVVRGPVTFRAPRVRVAKQNGYGGNLRSLVYQLRSQGVA